MDRVGLFGEFGGCEWGSYDPAPVARASCRREFPSCDSRDCPLSSGFCVTVRRRRGSRRSADDPQSDPLSDPQSDDSREFSILREKWTEWDFWSCRIRVAVFPVSVAAVGRFPSGISNCKCGMSWRGEGGVRVG